MSHRIPKFGPAQVLGTANRRPGPPVRFRVPAPVIGWSLCSPRGIVPADDPADAGAVHVGGHVNAVVALGEGEVLVGADTGGVWHLAPTVGAADRVRAFGLSADWENPDVICLAPGPDGAGHVFAGCRTLTEKLPGLYAALPVMYEAAPTGPGSWSVVMDGPMFGSVYGIGVADGRRLVAATSTGLWWSVLPAATDPPGRRVFSWHGARWGAGTAAAVGCTSLVIVDGKPVVSAASGGTIWSGSWDKRGGLVMSQVFTGLAGGGRSSLAVCTGQPSHLWCVVAQGDGPIGGVFRSDTGGRSWVPVLGTANDGDPSVHGSLADYGGGQGGYNNCIAVSPVDPTMVLIGWQSGVLVSSDNGASYLRWSGWRESLHPDVHCLYFDPRDRTGRTLFVGSDGGLASSTDSGTSFISTWNRSLANLQFASVPCRNAYGTMTASSMTPGRLAAGLQDNGVVWGSGTGSWRTIGGGDGAAAVLTSDDKVLLGSASAAGADLFAASPTGYSKVVTPPYVAADGSSVSGLPDPVAEAVTRPGHAGPPVMAVGGNGPDPGTVFGLRYNKPDGTDAVWGRLASLPTGVAIWSFAAADDATIYVGTAPPHVFRLDLSERGWTPTEQPGMPSLVPGQPDPNAAITRIVVLPDGSIAVAYNESSYASGCSTGQILHRDVSSGTWSRLNGPGTGLDLLPIFGLDVDPWGVLYAATDNHIFVSPGIGQGWQDASTGLPKRAHLGHLRFVRYPNGGVALFVGTWGRSAWKATWHIPARPGRQPGPGLTYNQLIGSTADGRLYELVHGGLHPVGPIDPELERRARASAATLVARVTDLQTAVTFAGLQLADVRKADIDASVALAGAEAVTNQLVSGLGTLTVVSDLALSWPVSGLAGAVSTATEQIAQATTAMRKSRLESLPPSVAKGLQTAADTSVAHAALMTKLEQTLKNRPA